MATNKNAQLRYNVLDRCFRNPGRQYFWQDLAEECSNAIEEHSGLASSISRKTIFNDMEFMKSEAGFSAPIISIPDHPRKYYRYEDMSFSIRNQPLNEQELNQLKDAVQFISRISGVAEFEWIHDIIPKLQIATDDKIGASFISYQDNVDLKNYHLIGEIFNAIRYKNALDLEYKSFKEESSFTCLFHPHHLKQYNSRWFVFGEVTEMKKVKGIHPMNFALDRIVSMSISKEKYITNKDINYEDYFDEIIGVSRYKQKMPVNIRFSLHPDRYKYVETKPMHMSQKQFRFDEETGWYKSSIVVVPNPELFQKFLSFGDNVIINSPVAVVKEMRLIVQNLNKLYK